MATTDNISKIPAVVSNAKFYPKLKDRMQDEHASPRHLVFGIYFGEETTFHFHTAGREAIWEISVKEATQNKRLVNGLLPEDALQLGFYYQRDMSKHRIRELVAANDELHSMLYSENNAGVISNANS